MPDPDDTPDSHVLPHHDSGTRISFEVLNVGDSGGDARVGVEVDDVLLRNGNRRFLIPATAP